LVLFLLHKKSGLVYTNPRIHRLSPFLFANKNGFLLRQGCGGQAGTWIALASLTHIASRRQTTLTGNLVASFVLAFLR